MEPRFNSRDLDNTQRLRAAARMHTLGPTLDDKVPVSETVKNLTRKVEKHKQGLMLRAKKERMAMVKMSEDKARRQRQMRVPMAKSEEDFLVPDDKLDPWELVELRKMALTSESYDPKSQSCTVEDLRRCLDSMILCGRIYVTDDIENLIEEERQARLALAEFDDVDPESEGKKEVSVDPITRFLEELREGSDGRAKVQDFVQAVAEGLGEVPPMKWRNATQAEAKSKSRELYNSTSVLRNRMALMGSSDPSERDAITSKIKELSNWAVKLEKIGALELSHKFNRTAGPRVSVRGDVCVVKESVEVTGLEGDEGLSDDEEEGRGTNDTDEVWEEKCRATERDRKRKDELMMKFGLKKEVQSRYRTLLHTRRPKRNTKKGHLLVTNMSKFDR